MGYYAERTPEIPQTVKFVVDTLKSAERDPSRTRASWMRACSIRSASSASRSMEIRKDPELGNKLFDRKDAVYGRMLPGYNVKGKDVPGAVYFTIGPDKQLDAWGVRARGRGGGDEAGALVVAGFLDAVRGTARQVARA